MTAERCNRYRDVEDRGPGDEAWRRHLRECPDCARQDRLDTLLRRGYESLSRPGLDPAFDLRVRRIVAAESGALEDLATAPGLRRRRARAQRHRWAQRLYWMAASGVCLAVVEAAAAVSVSPVGAAAALGAALLPALALTALARLLGTSPGRLLVRSI